MVAEVERGICAALQERERRADSVPAKVAAVSERISRLRSRLAAGDPDLEPDEIEAAIKTAEAKRQALLQAQPEAQEVAKVLALVPKVARTLTRLIKSGSTGKDPRAAAKARAILRKINGGPVRMVPDADGLYAEFYARPAALLKAAGTGVGTCGSGGRI